MLAIAKCMPDASETPADDPTKPIVYGSTTLPSHGSNLTEQDVARMLDRDAVTEAMSEQRQSIRVRTHDRKRNAREVAAKIKQAADLANAEREQQLAREHWQKLQLGASVASHLKHLPPGFTYARKISWCSFPAFCSQIPLDLYIKMEFF